jgi:putative serine protease PepD
MSLGTLRAPSRGRALAAALAGAAALGALAALAAPLAAPARAEEGAARLDRASARRLEERLVRLAEEASPRTVCVYGVIGLGTGAVVDGRGTVVTNAHVAAGARFAVVMSSDGTRRLYRRRGIDYEKDLAVLEPETPLEGTAPHFAIDAQRPAPGTDVVALGYPGGPRGADPRPTFTFGRVVEGSGNLSVGGILDYQDAIRTDVPTFSGNSGGPLVSVADGRLVGINGAVDLERAGNGLAVPAALVRDRLRTLEGGVILLPGGARIDPARNALVRRLEGALDPIVRRMAEANLKRPADGPVTGAVRALVPGAEGDPAAAAAFLERAAATGRNRDIAGAFGSPERRTVGAWLEVPGAGRRVAATPLDARTVVASADAARGTDLLEAPPAGRGGEYRRIATDEALGLALFRADEVASYVPPLSDDAAVGRFVAAYDEAGRAYGGVVSAPPRRVSDGNARALAASAIENPLVTRALEAAKHLARLFEAKELADLVAEIEKAMRLRRGFSAPSTARGFETVLSHDAPVPPSLAGAPLVDLSGRVVGVHVANAHFGTSYAVPIGAVRAAFVEHLGGEGRSAPRRRDPAAGAPARPRPEDAPRRPAAGKREPRLF